VVRVILVHCSKGFHIDSICNKQTNRKNKYVRVERFIKQFFLNRIYMQKTVVNYVTVRM